MDRNRKLALVAIANDREIQHLLGLCRSWQLPDPTLHAPGSPPTSTSGRTPVLLVGRGQTPHLADLLHNDHAFELLVTFDPSLLEHPDLLRRCNRVLVAPFDDDTLIDHLTDDHPHDPSPAVQEMLSLNILGDSPPIRRMLKVVATFAGYDTPVLLRGETGTGKEMVARGIHYTGARCDRPFVPVNCCALNDDLLLAELFGYEKGAFTDAKQAHPGLVAQASGGTLFLDEVDSLTPKGQGALLRFLQDREYRPLGGTSTLRSDVRVVSATNRDLEVLVAEGRFREDLYYRLHILHIQIPPLRERPGDVALLAEHFLRQFSQRYRCPEKKLHPITLEWMNHYPWPGNVRELENYLHRIFVLSTGRSICIPTVKGDPLHLTPASDTPRAKASSAQRNFNEAKSEAMEAFERSYLQEMLRTTDGNVSEAARLAGKERRAFGKLLKKYGIDRGNFGKD